jgi:hypothetical protein
MNRARDHLAPFRLSRQQRRRLDRALRKLFERNVCSFCGSCFPHNSQTAAGFDAHGNISLAGECCVTRVASIFARGFYSDRQYDFLRPPNTEPATNTEPTSEQITTAIALYQKAIAEADKALDGVERRGGGVRANGVVLLEHPWKSDDRDWFEQNPTRSHRIRRPFPGEVDEEVANTPAGTVLMMIVRQIEPGVRIRPAVSVDVELLPIPDDEATAHALFEAAMGREHLPPDPQALRELSKKYSMRGGQSDA